MEGGASGVALADRVTEEDRETSVQQITAIFCTCASLQLPLTANVHSQRHIHLLYSPGVEEGLGPYWSPRSLAPREFCHQC